MKGKGYKRKGYEGTDRMKGYERRGKGLERGGT